MIVKNEASLITKCLESVINDIDYWVICDTGSTDGTQDIIINYFKENNKEGKLYEREWKNFGYNRTEVFKLAESIFSNFVQTNTQKKFDFYMVIDADDILVGNMDHFKNTEDYNDAYYVKIKLGNTVFQRIQVFNCQHTWKYVGVLHEYPCCGKKNLITSSIPDCYILASASSSRMSEPTDKYLKDANILLQGIIDEPDNTRYHFYLAQSYRDAECNDEAMKWYKKRVELGGWNEEVYFAMYSYALCKYKTNKYSFKKEVLHDFLKAYEYRPSRLEALYEIVKYFRIKKSKKGYKYGILGYDACLNFPSDILFVNSSIHSYQFMDELAGCAYHAHKYDLSIELNNKLIKMIKENKINLDLDDILFNRQRSLDAKENTVVLNVKKLNKEQYNLKY